MSDETEYHALVSPSGSYKWLACPGSLAMESKIENTSSEFADEGTCAHTIGSLCLENNIDAATYIGQKLTVGKRTFKVDEDMAEHVQTYVDQVRGYVEEYKLRGAVRVELFVEVQVPIGHITGEEGARGTSDFIIIAVWADGTATIHCGDLKFGKGVEVEAEDNPQLKMYALGALELHELMYEFKDVRLTIHQPRIKTAASEWGCSIDHLIKFGKHASERAHHALVVLNNEKEGAWIHHLKAGEHCKKAFCRARGHCPKLDQFVSDSVGMDFDEIGEMDVKKVVEALPNFQPDDSFGSISPEMVAPSLTEKMAVLDIIDDWIKAVRGRVEYELLHGHDVPGWKLVQGRQGNRAWSDEDEAEALMKSMRLKTDQMYTFKVISPTTAEKVLKEKPKCWKKVQTLISRSDGKPSVAPESDNRPALVIAPPADDFDAADNDLEGLL